MKGNEMDLNDMKVGDVLAISRAMSGASTIDESHWHIGDNYFIRTVTHHVLGRLVKVAPQELVIVDAAWIADDGRFSECMANGTASEVEPWPDGVEVIIGRGSILDATRWPHALMRVVK